MRGKNRLFTDKLIFLGLLIIPLMFFLSSLTVIADDETLNIGGDRIIKCGADTVGVCTTSAGPIELYDNLDFTNTYDNSITIDSCIDGTRSTPESWKSTWDMIEYTQKMSRTDLNTTNEGGVTDGYVREGDIVQLSVVFICPPSDSDPYSLLYKNNTNASTPWTVLTTGNCPPDFAEPHQVEVNVNKKLDSVSGNHTIRAIIYYDTNADILTTTCGYDADQTYSDTDDLVIEAIESLDVNAPVISISYPSEDEQIEFEEGQIINLNFTVTDRTNVSYVNITLKYSNVTLGLNYTRIGDNYFANITNVSFLGRYNISFFANDTINTNSTLGTRNHRNNDTTTYFILKNDVNVNFQSPSFNSIYSYQNLSLGVTINDFNLPFSEVYYSFNNIRTELNDSNYIETVNTTLEVVNNSVTNISQSFNLSKNISLINIGLLIKRVGGNDSNSTIHLINDSAGPFGNILATAVVSNISNESFAWKKITFNQPVEIIINEKYWITILNESLDNYLLFGSNNTYLQGELYLNASIDIGLRVYDAKRYNSSISSNEGLNTLSVCENNNIPNLVCGYTQFYVDLTPPYFSSITYTSPYVEYGINQTVTVDVYDSISSISNVYLIFNGTNYSMTRTSSLSNGGRYSKSLSLGIGAHNFSISANDSSSLRNTTSIYLFSVNDTLAPALNTTRYFPNTTDLIDPNVSVSINFSLYDINRLNETLFQYRANTSSTWINITPVSLSNYSFSTNFTPTLETTYFYRFYSKDQFNNVFYSQNYTINASFERVWSYTPLVYDSILVDIGQSVSLYSVNITNSADVDLSFNLTKTSNVDYSMIFSNNSLIIPRNSTSSIEINITAPSSGEGEHASTFIVACLDGCPVRNATLGKSIIVGLNEPYLDLKVYKRISEGEVLNTLYTLRFNDDTYTTPNYFIARIKNIAPIAADNITFAYEFPNASQFIITTQNPENLSANFSLERKNFDDTKDVGISFLINRNTRRGVLYNLSIYANLTYNNTLKNFSHKIQINVTNVEEVYNPAVIIQTTTGSSGSGGSSESPATPSLGGSGGSVASSGGLGGGITLNYDLSVSNERNIELFRGLNKTIQVNITNNIKNKYFSNIKLDAEGYYKNHIKISPRIIEELKFNETKSFNVTFFAPSYLGYSINEIKLKFDYLVVSDGYNISSGDSYDTESFLTLIVNEVSRDDSFACLEESIRIIDNASSSNYNVNSLNMLFDEQRVAVFSLDFTKAKKLCDNIKMEFEHIISYDKRLTELLVDITSSTEEGYSLNDVLRLANITKAQFINGEYATLENSIKDLENAYLLQLKIEDSNIVKRLKKFFINNIKIISVFIIISSILGYIMFRRIMEVRLKNKIEDLKLEKKEIEEKLKDLQKSYYMDKSLSSDYFNTHNELNKERIAKINEGLLDSHYKSLKLEKKTSNLEILESKKVKIKESISDLQKQYYIDKSMDKKSYESLFSNYNNVYLITNKEINLLKKNKTKNQSRVIDSYKKFINILKFFYKNKV